MSLLELLQKALPFVPSGKLHEQIVDALSQQHEVHLLHSRLRLTPIEREIISVLSENIGRPMDVETLQKRTSVKTLDSLFVHKFRLQKKLERAKAGAITCRRGTGYTLELNQDG